MDTCFLFGGEPLSNIASGMKTAIPVVAAVFFCLGFFLLGRRYERNRPLELPVPDTVIRVDTIRDTVPVSQKVYAARIDTCWLRSAADTVYVSDTVRVLVPIERREYATEEYRAVVEGWHPSLVEMEVYPKTKTVTRCMTRETVRKTRWGIGIQAGYWVGTWNGKSMPVHVLFRYRIQYDLLVW